MTEEWRKEFRKFIGQSVRKMRIKEGVSLEELAKKLKIDPEELTMIELGLKELKGEMVEKIGKVLSKPLTSFLLDEKELAILEGMSEEEIKEAIGHFKELIQEFKNLTPEERDVFVDYIVSKVEEEKKKLDGNNKESNQEW